ncbi:TlpA family protein disulfide reductase [Verrucomicrobiaceae bacterium 5K15]|uniref:TlpA family protein disulfide reductase n=1 Tax=Oceaniferula flava TaxID=2800421 RepID=A0AAE2VC88_9BACT|nr:TlpA disulfide reductase family protein [Oceaniferula flavus]MBK1855360.1 TlpA family protein disulfide reductase [Oceaniferula flavus]MBM1136666.1 TlpA family protein disulfide reductase [Oceaniferula flavus]
MTPKFAHKFLAGAALALACVTSAVATPKHTLSEFTPGDLVSGPEVDFSKATGKVVVIDYWGTRCPPCLALMPHISKLHKRYSAKGLMLVAAESQGSTTEAIDKVVKKNRLECSVTKFVRGPKLSSGLPHMAVFDVDGNLVFSGRPGDEADRVIKKELKRASGDVAESEDTSASGPLVKNRTWTNANGRTMSAMLVSLEGNTGTFRKVGGTPFDYDITKLSEADQEMIREAAAK